MSGSVFVGSTIIGLVAALLPALVLSIDIYHKHNKFPNAMRYEQKKKDAIAEAIAEGRHATAHRIKCALGDSAYEKAVTYQYEYGGKKYKYFYIYTSAVPGSEPPLEVEVYFRKSPKYAQPIEQFGKMETERYKLFFALWFGCWVVISTVIMILVGGA